MTQIDVAQPAQWLLLVFFVLFALYGFSQKRGSTCLGCLALGIGALLINVGLLLLAERVGYGSYAILDLVTLREIAIESSLLVLGYCLIVHALATWLRLLVSARPMRSRTYL